ncbi:hypothetical protein CDAR_520171 [Caerostris darwini]|uniref:Uncharacterized protein n=1 Tax=Caerostris darwini TaxID=1538125 RepID=A0AAV4TU89_9ARAC|nr:hypothetical protein CDAR_520171 [Caerostris darwini]
MHSLEKRETIRIRSQTGSDGCETAFSGVLLTRKSFSSGAFYFGFLSSLSFSSDSVQSIFKSLDNKTGDEGNSAFYLPGRIPTKFRQIEPASSSSQFRSPDCF